MYETSQLYKDNINKDIRKIVAEVSLNITGVIENELEDTSLEFVLSNGEQVINENYRKNFNLVTYEDDRIVLDGSFRFADEIKENNKEQGFISDNLCDINGDFIDFPFITLSTTSIPPFFGCTIFFDNSSQEYATEFDIEVYNGLNLVKIIEIIDNKDIEFTTFDETVTNFNNIRIIIKKWSKPNRRARVIEAEIGVVKVYNENKIMNLKLIEEMDFEGDLIPIPELVVNIEDIAKEYDFMNPNGIYKFLNSNLLMNVRFGVEVIDNDFEFIPLGQYKLIKWNKGTGVLTTTLESVHILNNLTKYEIIESNITNFYDFIVNIFTICGITDFEIDTSLQSLSLFGKHKTMNARELLQHCLIASCSRLTIERDGTVKIINSLPNGITNNISFDKAYVEPNMELENALKSITVEYYSNVIDFEDKNEIIYINTDVEDGDIIEIKNNTLINSSNRAEQVKNHWIELKKYRGKSNTEWRGDISVELGDKINVETPFGNKDGYVIENEIVYDGFFNQYTKVKHKIEGV